MPGKNTNLHAAKRAKNDEFYTQLTDIEKEISEMQADQHKAMGQRRSYDSRKLPDALRRLQPHEI